MKVARLAVAASLFAIGSVPVSVFAQSSCDSPLTSYNSAGCDASCQQYIRTNHPECFATANDSSSSAQIQATTVQQITAISTSVSTRMLALGFQGPAQKMAAAEVTGIAAAGNTKPFSVWGNLGQAHTSYSGDSALTNADKFGSTVTNTIVGFDYAFAADKIVGLSIAGDRGAGSVGNRATATTTKGLNYAPYFGWQINKNLALDASVGVGDGEFSSTTRSDSKRSFYAANLSYSDWKDNLQLVGKAGYLWAKEKYGDQVQAGATLANTSSSSTLSQFRIAGEVGYWMNGAMPFVGLAYSTDHRSGSRAVGQTIESKLGKDAFTVSLGVNFFSLSSGVTGGVVYTQESGRDNGKNDTLSANVSMKF